MSDRVSGRHHPQEEKKGARKLFSLICYSPGGSGDPFVVGALLAVAVAALGKVTRFDQDGSFYPTVLVIIASYYILFAILGGSTHALVWETVVALAFSVVAVFGALCLPLLVGIGIVAHGLFDLVHHVIIQNPGVPSWWPSFCMSLDVLLGLWVIGLYRFRRNNFLRMSP